MIYIDPSHIDYRRSILTCCRSSGHRAGASLQELKSPIVGNTLSTDQTFSLTAKKVIQRPRLNLASSLKSYVL